MYANNDAPGATPATLVAATAKDGHFYLLNPANLGGKYRTREGVDIENNVAGGGNAEALLVEAADLALGVDVILIRRLAIPSRRRNLRLHPLAEAPADPGEDTENVRVTRGEEVDARSDLFSLGVLLYEGAGAQHIAVATRDIVGTVTELRRRGVEFLTIPDSYYEKLPRRVGDLTVDQAREALAAAWAERPLGRDDGGTPGAAGSVRGAAGRAQPGGSVRRGDRY